MSAVPAVEVLGPFHVHGLRSRHVRVCVPPRSRRAAAPGVLFAFDGQNLFDDAPSFAGGWHLHEAVGSLARQRRRAPIVVGIDHGGEERIRELSPWTTRHGEGRLEDLLGWIVGGLAPLVAQRYGADLHPRSVMVGGSSLGGLAALYAHFRHPQLFGGAMAMSPSLWLGGGRIFEHVAHTSKPWSSRIWLDVGGREVGSMRTLAERMASELSARGYRDNLSFRVDARAGHQERAWRRRAPAALRYLFSGKNRAF